MNTITPNGVRAVNTIRWRPSDLLACVDLRDIRRARLEKFAKARGVDDNPGGLGELIGKKGNQVYNLLHGDASFGEKVARSIESSAGLPAGWLDVEEGEQAQLWPFRKVALDRFLALSIPDRSFVEGQLLSAIAMCEAAALGNSPKQPLAEPPIQGEDIPSGHAQNGSTTDEQLRRTMQRSRASGAPNESSSAKRAPGKRGDRRA